MKTAWMISAAALLCGALRMPAADSVELNGISLVGQEKLACFLFFQESAPKPRTFMLAEGESKFGFKLLAVDATGHRVLVEKCGVKKYVHINATPDVIATNQTEPEAEAVASGKVPPPDAGSMSSYLNSDETARILAGNPLLPSAVVPGAGKNSNSGTGANNTGSNAGTGTGSQSSGGTTTSTTTSGSSSFSANSSGAGANQNSQNSQNGQVNELWYQESLSIEQSRAMTTDDVLSGKLSPFPLTPLTPASTPSALIGQEVYFSDHIPGYKVTGFLNE